MSPDAPDRPVSFARLQQQLILTEVELMKLEDLRDGLQTRVDAANKLGQDMQRLADHCTPPSPRSWSATSSWPKNWPPSNPPPRGAGPSRCAASLGAAPDERPGHRALSL